MSKIELPNLYNDQIAQNYDSFYKPTEEGRILIDFFKDNIKEEKILDIGCGTGMMLDILNIKPENYLGIDISYPMAKVSKTKHPEYSVVNGSVLSVQSKFKTGVAVFGVMSYLSLDEVKHINNIIEDNIFLMGYANKYDSRILKHYKQPTIKGDIKDLILKKDILRNKFKDLRVFKLANYYVYTNFKSNMPEGFYSIKESATHFARTG